MSEKGTNKPSSDVSPEKLAAELINSDDFWRGYADVLKELAQAPMEDSWSYERGRIVAIWAAANKHLSVDKFRLVLEAIDNGAVL